MGTREQNQKKFSSWIDLSDGTRMYWHDVPGKHGWKARYIKIVDQNEITLRFAQEVYDTNGELVEIHEKYPVDKGHQKVK